jgi:hydroxypyruvate reductase
MPQDGEMRRLLRTMFDAAVAAADPMALVPEHLPEAPRGRTIVVGAGKASGAMARAFERAWRGPLSGLVVTRYGHAVPCERIEIVEAAHPVPDAAGETAARRMIDLVRGLTEDDLVVALLSGGGSALLAAPAPGLTLGDKQTVNRALLACGASIDEMNCVRKHLSAIKGGRLATAAYPARVETLLISDVPGDDPAVIASGPTLPDRTTFADAREILARYGIVAPEAVRSFLDRAAEETPKPGDLRLQRAIAKIIATPQMSLRAAAGVAREAGFTPLILSDAIEGEAREAARVLAAIASQAHRHGEPARTPCVLLSGGETTVTIRGRGRGGRNVEFLLALAIALRGQGETWAIAADTDGVDGAEEAAGAVLTPDTLARARAKAMSAADHLANNDAHAFFEALGDQVVTGPTLTNVNDFRAIVITGR